MMAGFGQKFGSALVLQRDFQRNSPGDNQEHCKSPANSAVWNLWFFGLFRPHAPGDCARLRQITQVRGTQVAATLSANDSMTPRRPQSGSSSRPRPVHDGTASSAVHEDSAAPSSSVSPAIPDADPDARLLRILVDNLDEAVVLL